MTRIPDETAALVAAARRGDEAARAELLRRNLPALRAFLRLRLDPELRLRESCSDLVQSTCREVLGGLDDLDYRGEAPFRAWLFTVARNKLQERRRFHLAERRRHDRELAAQDVDALALAYSRFATASQDARARELVERLEAAFDRLPEDQREVLTMTRLAGLSTREVAAHIGRSEDATRALLGRALARLAGLIDRGE